MSQTESKTWIEKYGSLIIDTIKAIVLITLSILIYCKITKPDSVLNKTKTEREVQREQAKLLIDLFKESDVAKLENGYKIIRFSYKSIDSIGFIKIDSLFNTWMFNKQQTELTNEYIKLLTERAEILRKYKNSYDGIGEFVVGKSKIAPDISYILKFIDIRAAEIEKKLLISGMNISTIRYYKEYNNFINE